MARIKNNEELKENKERLRELVERYEWLTISEHPLEDLKRRQDFLFEEYRDKRVTVDKMLEIEAELQKISVVGMYIRSIGTDEYEAMLMKEIQELAASVCEYEANERLSKKSILDLIRSVAKGDEKIKNDLNFRRAFIYAENIGRIGNKSQNPNLMPSDVILERMAKQIDWARLEVITDEERKEAELQKEQVKETALVVSNESTQAKRLEPLMTNIQLHLENLGLGNISEKANNKQEENKSELNLNGNSQDVKMKEKNRSTRVKKDKNEKNTEEVER